MTARGLPPAGGEVTARGGALGLWAAAVLGALVGAGYCVIGVMLVLRTGMAISASLVTPVLLWALLRPLAPGSGRHLAWAQTAASAASLAVFSLESGFAAAWLARSRAPVPPALALAPAGAAASAGSLLWSASSGPAAWASLVLVGLGAGAVAVGVGLCLQAAWLGDPALPFPKAQAIGRVIASLAPTPPEDATGVPAGAAGAPAGVPAGLRQVLGGAGAGAGAGLLSRAFGLEAGLVPTRVLPAFINFQGSPLLLGLGMMLPLRTAAHLLAGAAVSTLAWVLAEGASPRLGFAQHLQSPWVLSLALGLILGQTAMSALGLLARPLSRLFGAGRARPGLGETPGAGWRAADAALEGGRPRLAGGAAVVCGAAVSVLAGSFLLGLGPLLMALLAWPAALVMSYVTARTRAETGVGTTAAAYVIIPLCALAAGAGRGSAAGGASGAAGALVAAGALTMCTVVASDFLEAMKVGRVAGVRARELRLPYVAGWVSGLLAGCLALVVLARAYGFGGVELPAPTSQAWLLVAQAVAGRALPPSLNPWTFLAGAAAAVVLDRLRASGLQIGMGCLLPVSVSVPMIAGGLAAGLWRRLAAGKGGRGSPATAAVVQNVGAGLITGDALVGMGMMVRLLLGPRL